MVGIEEEVMRTRRREDKIKEEEKEEDKEEEWKDEVRGRRKKRVRSEMGKLIRGRAAQQRR